jgi:GNAT superfamily N-acetyltransferase
MSNVDRSILRLGVDDVPEIVDVLCESFYDYPVMRFVLGPETDGYSAKLRILLHFFAMARVLRGEIMLGIGERANLDGAALVSRPAGPASPAELSDLREQVWAELGSSARARYEAFGAASAQSQVDVPHIHLSMIGVRRRARGVGLGRSLIEHVHLLSRNDIESEGVTLNTEKAVNVPLYEHFGYKLVSHATVAPGLETWSFFRPD